MDSIESLLRENGRCWVDLGVVTTPPAPSLVPGGAIAARHVTVALVPSGRVVEARVANLGQGAGKGAFVPLQVGDEVLVLFPSGDPLRAVVLGGLGSAKAPNPVENDNLGALLMHPGGFLLSTATGLPGNGIVHGQLLVELQALVTALSTFMASVTAATSAGAPTAQIAAIAAAATTFSADPNVVTFLTNLGASATSGTLPGVGGPPYATTFHRVTT